MEDLSSLSRSLNEVLSSPEGGETLASIIEQYLTTTDLVKKQAVCDTLLDILNEDDETAQSKKREMILSETSLTYLPLLLPLSTIISSSKEIIFLIAKYSKSREVVLGLNEGIQSILDRAEGYQVSDDEDGFEEDSENDGVNWPELIDEYGLIISCLNVAIPKLPNSKSTPTLLSLNEAISSSLPILSHHTTSYSSRNLSKSLCELVDTIWNWVQTTSDKGGEQRALLSNLIFEAITLLGHKQNAKLAERWFLKTFPKFKQMPNSQELIDDGLEGWKAGQEILDQAWSITTDALNFTPDDLLQNIINPSHLTVHASLASLNLLASRMISNDVSIVFQSSISETSIDDSMPILCSALSGSSVDAGITYLWSFIHHSLSTKDGYYQGDLIEYDNASMLLELLVPLTAQHPSSVMRLSLFKLIENIISTQFSVINKVMLFKQLLEPANPFENIRIQSLSLLRENITSKKISSPLLTGILFPILFPSPKDQDLESQDNTFELSIPDLLESPFIITWWTECLTLLWFLLDFDKEDITHIHQNMKNDGNLTEWLNAVESKLKDLQFFFQTQDEAVRKAGEESRSHDHDFNGLRFLMMRFEDSLSRVKRALNQ
ncbi:uncharacterized protein L201_007887 [Kwoniella dendrophila CBS 6074]|uniref:Uncharacterized protein n=1 Tax=Kwoniella dendrophila CBS 6074 TaxID=1295534 RepID=A0AAX4K6A4_9TREE